MADSADRAAELQQAEIDRGIAAAATARLTSTGRVAACIDCREPLTPARRAMGANRCVECKTDHEEEARRYGRR